MESRGKNEINSRFRKDLGYEKMLKKYEQIEGGENNLQESHLPLHTHVTTKEFFSKLKVDDKHLLRVRAFSFMAD
jgi:hypothetical protein